MRVDNHVYIRHNTLYHFEKGHTAAEAFRDLYELFGWRTIGERQVRRWFNHFESGNTSLKDEEGRGRPSDFDDQALLQAVVGMHRALNFPGSVVPGFDRSRYQNVSFH